MELQKRFARIAIFLVALTLCVQVRGQLSADFYATSCPSVESLVKSSITQSVQKFPITIQAVLRLFLHDCFVEGCDASIMISSPDNTAEKNASPNQSLAGDGFSAIINAKSQVEARCPGVVSCADIMAIAVRDAVGLANGPTWEVLKGRRDGKISLASRVQGNLPEANYNLDELKAAFGAKGLNIVDMVALSGAHTLGFAHCSQFTNRLYQFNTTYQVDPTLDPQYATRLQVDCPFQRGDPNQVEPLDILTPAAFDNAYYKNLQAHKGLLTSDQILFTDARTRSFVTSFATNQSAFFAAFAVSMVNLSKVGVKIGSQGEIRKDCSSFNS